MVIFEVYDYLFAFSRSKSGIFDLTLKKPTRFETGSVYQKFIINQAVKQKEM